MSLTPEDRQRIYVEEKARIEAQQRIAHETRIETQRQQAQGFNKPLNQFIVVVLLLAFIFTAIPAYQSMMKSSQTSSEPGSFTAPSAPLPDMANLLTGQDEADKKKVIVSKGWTFTGADHYDYLRGSVKNTSSRTVGYWKISASFFDKKKNIIDTAFTNSGETLIPGASKRFEIMHSHIPNTDNASVYVEEVTFQ